MDREEILNYLGSEEGQGLLNETGYIKGDKETIGNYLDNTEEGKALKFSIGDTAHNNYMKKLEEKGKKVYGEDDLKALRSQWREEDNPTLTPEQVRIKELEDRLNSQDKKEKISNNYKALEDLNKDYGLPVELIRMSNDLDFEKAKGNLENIGGIWKTAMEQAREEVRNGIKTGSLKPGSSNGNPSITYEEFKTMSKSQKAKLTTEQLNQILKG